MTHQGSGQGAARLRARFCDCELERRVGDREADRIPMQALDAGQLDERGARP